MKILAVCCLFIAIVSASGAYAANNAKDMMEQGKGYYSKKQYKKALSTFMQVGNMTGKDTNMALSDPDKYEERRYFNAVSYYWAGLSTHEMSNLSKNSEEKDRKYREALKLYHASCEAGYDKACSKYDGLTSRTLNNAITNLRTYKPPNKSESNISSLENTSWAEGNLERWDFYTDGLLEITHINGRGGYDYNYLWKYRGKWKGDNHRVSILIDRLIHSPQKGYIDEELKTKDILQYDGEIEYNNLILNNINYGERKVIKRVDDDFKLIGERSRFRFKLDTEVDVEAIDKDSICGTWVSDPNRLFIFNIHNDGSYNIMNNEKIIDKGKWKLKGNMLIFNGDRENCAIQASIQSNSSITTKLKYFRHKHEFELVKMTE
jgi:hypothetical protein